jgi:hypothetical protein
VFAELVISGFSTDNLRTAIIGGDPLQAPENKLHFNYLIGYLAEIGCKTIVVEHPYVDADYLDDYSAYYVRCFKRYKRKCRRLHFFSNNFAQADLEKYLIGAEDKKLTKKQLQEAYLGFTVIKPLPEAYIGKTVLQTYPPEAGRRHFPCKRPYFVGFFGTELKVDSLAFQEQDTVLAACATTALWCAFHKTAELFSSKLPTPAQITNAAAENFLFGSRAFPSHGLNVWQMCQAIKDVGLEPELRDFENIRDLSGFIMSYLSFGIPVILVIEILRPHISPEPASHAVTIVGYSIGGDPTKITDPGIPLRAHAIDKYYVHDDQVGPFSRLELDNPVRPTSLITGWKCKCGCDSLLNATPKAVLVPVYHKIRITFENVAYIVKAFHEFFDSILNGSLSWEIVLSNVNNLKTSYFHNNKVYSKQINKILLHNYPRYIWRAILYFNGRRSIELIFDSTAIERSMFLDDVIFCCEEIKQRVTEAIKLNVDEAYLPIEYGNFFRQAIDDATFDNRAAPDAY